MKKRILAILLACMMVITAIPFSVFAESEECSHLQEDGSHRKSAMSEGDYEQVGDVVAPTCSKNGYTTYKCLECGAYFADDITAKDKNNHGETEEHDAIDAECGVGGYTAGIWCKDCETYVSGHEKVDALKHNFVKTPLDNEKYCGGKICSICGTPATGKDAPKDAHEWSEFPTIVKEPTYKEAGEAEFDCKNCDATRTVVVEKQCLHNLEEVKGKAPVLCSKDSQTLEDGVKAHWHCTICEKNFEDKDATKELDKVVISAEHDMETIKHAATCTTYGLAYDMCTVCGYVDEDTMAPIKPISHTSYEDAKKAGLVGSYSDSAKPKAGDLGWVPATCEEDGHYEWTCIMCKTEKCEFVPKYSDKYSDKKLRGTAMDPAKGHKEVEVTVPGTCFEAGYTFVYCANTTICDHKADAKAAHTIDKVSYTLGTKLDANQKANGSAVIMLEFTLGEKNADFHDRTKVTITSEDYNAPTCTTAGSQLVYCTHCEVEVWETLKALGHSWEKDKKGNAVWESIDACVNDGYTKTRTCLRADCGHTEFDGFVEVVTDPEMIFSKADAEKMHGTLTAVEGGLKFEGSCSAKGFQEFACESCKKSVLVYLENGTGSHIKPKSYVAAPDCQADAGWECEGCKETFDAREANTVCDGTVIVAAKAANCADGSYKVDYCSICKTFRVYKEDSVVEFKESSYKKTDKKSSYDLAKEAAVAAAVIKATDEHDWDEIEAAVDATCTEKGKTAKNKCSVCGKTEGGKETPANGHNYEMKVTYKKDKKTYVDEAASIYDVYKVQEATCTKYGFTYSKCSACGVEHVNYVSKLLPHDLKDVKAKDATCTEKGWTAHKACACGYTEGKEEIAALGHKNAAGEALYDDCTKYDLVTDHKCAAEGCDYEAKRTCKNEVVDQVVAATCTEGGYTIKYCPDCAAVKVVDPTPALDPNHDKDNKDDWIYVKTVAATATAPAYEVYKCPNCDVTENRAINALDLHFEVENANGKDGFTDSSIVNVALMISGTGVDVAGLNFTINYDAKNLVFLGAEFGDVFNPANGGCLINDIKKTENKKEVSVGQLKVLATNMTAEGPKDVELENVAVLLNLQFRVASADASKAGSAEISIAAVEALKANGAVVENSAAPKATINFSQFMDFSLDAADGAVTLADAFSAYQMILGTLVDDNDTKDTKDDKVVTYDVALDVDKDGVITAADVTSIYQYIVGILTYDQMLALGTK